MEVKAKFDHFNINVLDLEKSMKFYEQAIGFKEHHRKEAKDGSFTLVYLTDGQSPFLLELTWLKDRKEPYELGDNESHLCVRVPGDYAAVREYHREMGCIAYENKEMGLYFITDPDDYWIEILPLQK
ncbi:lactoylglutathione lyase [Bacteroides sp. 214]|uniref:VOC family protein n=1 Tax=Bacteroides sp. 214 TaxID=2302935 RepID=UPI0013D57BB9|nr:VOC family protein [Bacteroides sp. 214]NDW12497.1 lactoylglutathione lyase [Bacteroides sp. 214]